MLSITSGWSLKVKPLLDEDAIVSLYRSRSIPRNPVWSGVEREKGLKGFCFLSPSARDSKLNFLTVRANSG